MLYKLLLKTKILDYLQDRYLNKMINFATKLGFDRVEFNSDGKEIVYAVTFTNTEARKKVKMAELYPDSK
mgnify:FL=1|tara:strand:+ start:2232 stop:2441 length:210 start_codon:yes stop_codon:yes gene_type:complete